MAVNYHDICFITLAPGLDLIKLFCVNFLTLFEKLDHFISATITYLSCEKI
jgi:hypothetical protein